MTVTRLRPLAEADLVERARYDSTEGGTDLGVRFDAAVASLRATEKMPNARDLPIMLADLDTD